MIVLAAKDGVRLVTQADHARFAADLLRLFRVEEVARHPRRELLLRAVAEHDNGWWEADAAPRWDPATRCALDFRLLPTEERQEIWQRGVERFAGESPYLAALIATHALRLLQRWRPEPTWEDFGRALALRRDEWLVAAGEDCCGAGDGRSVVGTGGQPLTGDLYRRAGLLYRDGASDRDRRARP